MSNSNPLPARQAKKRRRKAGDLAAVQQLLWTAILEAEAVLLQSDDPELTLKAVHAISQCAGQYVKLLETGEFEVRLQELEAARGGAYAGIA